MVKHEKVSTGMPGFDKVIDMLRMGDNVVWQIDELKDYGRIVRPFVVQAKKDRRKLVYMHFGNEPEILKESDGVMVFRLDPSKGFEGFALEVRRIVTDMGKGAFFVFDCLSELVEYWQSDLMLWNFFRVSCPYLYEMDTVAYFALKRGIHTYDSVAGIRQTTQCLMDVYNIADHLYIHPLKATGRYSPTMFFPHRISGNEAVSITASTETAELFSEIHLQTDLPDFWDRMLIHARRLLARPESEQEPMKEKLIDAFLERNPRMRKLCARYFSLADLVRIASREIGTGYIGGKSTGMLLARKVIEKAGGENADLKQYMSAEDSFFIGTDAFYTYIVQNGWWTLRTKQRTEEGYLTYAAELKEKLLTGDFPEKLEYEFIHMLEYFGQAPIIVRSSSLLEDHFGNAFAGKYDSVFCVNQGTPEERLEALEQAVRMVYASTMNPDALAYRRQRGLADQDEQMAILVQRVSGDYFGKYFFPHAAGVGNSANLYVWSSEMDMNAGMLRLVMGLGTRAVDRIIGDYVRLVPLDDPGRLQQMHHEDEKKFSQHKADVLNLAENKLESIDVSALMKEDLHVNPGLFAVQDYEEARRLREIGQRRRPVPYIVNFKKMLQATDFPVVMKRVLKLLEAEYDYPVDIEFTVNYTSDTEFKFNLVQCRPLQTRGPGEKVKMPDIRPEDSVFYTKGNFMGGNVRLPIDYTVFVDVGAYLACTEQEKYQTARVIGELNERLKEHQILLAGPGRWGTTTISLGVPVHFTEISHMAAICEVGYQDRGLMPELSFGSHFFQDLVETGIFYIALFNGRKDVVFEEEWMKEENCIEEILPHAGKMKDVIYVRKTQGLQIFSDIKRQEALAVIEN